jgi:hypothetical protein
VTVDECLNGNIPRLEVSVIQGDTCGEIADEAVLAGLNLSGLPLRRSEAIEDVSISVQNHSQSIGVAVGPTLEVSRVETVPTVTPNSSSSLCFEIFKDYWKIVESPGLQPMSRNGQHFQTSNFRQNYTDFQNFNFLHFELQGP